MKYDYRELVVTCLNKRRFPISKLREAVEYLKTQDQTDYVGLTAVAHYKSERFGFQLRSQPLLRLEEIIGRTPREIWAIYDAKVTDDVLGLEKRFDPRYKNG